MSAGAGARVSATRLRCHPVLQPVQVRLNAGTCRLLELDMHSINAGVEDRHCRLELLEMELAAASAPEGHGKARCFF